MIVANTSGREPPICVRLLPAFTPKSPSCTFHAPGKRRGPYPKLPFDDVVNRVQPVKSPVAKSPLVTRVSAFASREIDTNATVVATANMLFQRRGNAITRGNL